MPAAPLTFSVIALLLPIPDWALSRWDDKSLARMMINGCRHRGADRAVGLRNRRAEPGSDPLAGAGGQRMLTLNHLLPTKKRLGHTVEAFFT